MVVSVLTGVASALYDKHILGLMEPLFVQSWTNLYISIILALVLLADRLRDRKGFRKFQWDWKLLLIAVLITGSAAGGTAPPLSPSSARNLLAGLLLTCVLLL